MGLLTINDGHHVHPIADIHHHAAGGVVGPHGQDALVGQVDALRAELVEEQSEDLAQCGRVEAARQAQLDAVLGRVDAQLAEGQLQQARERRHVHGVLGDLAGRPEREGEGAAGACLGSEGGGTEHRSAAVARGHHRRREEQLRQRGCGGERSSSVRRYNEMSPSSFLWQL